MGTDYASDGGSESIATRRLYLGLSWLLSMIASGCVSGSSLKAEVRPGGVRAELPGVSSTAKGLTVAIYNVWGLPSWLNGASASRYGKIAEGLGQLESDVVLLQEVWTQRCFAELYRQSRSPERTWWAAYSRRNGTFLGQNGLLTLSRCPILGAEFKRFSDSRLPDALMNKGALKVTIATPTGQRFNVWNVHLQDGEGASRRVRERQTAELVGWIKEADDAQTADIVGGDFNFTPDSSEFRWFVASVGTSIHQLAGSSVFPTWDGLKPGRGQTLDHIFVKLRQPVEEGCATPCCLFAASHPKDRLSDHMGVEAALTFGSATKRSPAGVVQRMSSSVLLPNTMLAPP
jgi:endonuclease/exonuclease/phosphatase family metal-dependent hydrolase